MINIINIWAILIATAIQFFLGYLWYSKFLFGKQFVKALGKSEDELEMKVIDIVGPLIVAFLAFLFFAIILELMAPFNLGIAMIVALVLAGFAAATNIYPVFFEERNWMLYLLNVGYQFVGFIIGGLILGLWII